MSFDGYTHRFTQAIWPGLRASQPGNRCPTRGRHPGSVSFFLSHCGMISCSNGRIRDRGSSTVLLPIPRSNICLLDSAGCREARAPLHLSGRVLAHRASCKPRVLLSLQQAARPAHKRPVICMGQEPCHSTPRPGIVSVMLTLYTLTTPPVRPCTVKNQLWPAQGRGKGHGEDRGSRVAEEERGSQ